MNILKNRKYIVFVISFIILGFPMTAYASEQEGPGTINIQPGAADEDAEGLIWAFEQGGIDEATINNLINSGGFSPEVAEYIKTRIAEIKTSTTESVTEPVEEPVTESVEEAEEQHAKEQIEDSEELEEKKETEEVVEEETVEQEKEETVPETKDQFEKESEEPINPKPAEEKEEPAQTPTESKEESVEPIEPITSQYRISVSVLIMCVVLMIILISAVTLCLGHRRRK